jgi:hypothetical protein
MTTNRVRLAVLVAACTVSGAADSLGQSYGDSNQTLTIGAAAFEAQPPAPMGADAIGPDGYLYGGALTTTWWAPILLPDGAWLEEICVYYRDNGTGLFDVAFPQSSLAAEGQTPAIGGFGFVASTQVEGYQFRCSAINKRLRDLVDLDGDGTPDPTTIRLRASASGAIGLGAVQIRWKREVSPPPATPTFGDVNPGDSAWNHIEALAASGITAGCGEGNFCPDATLTRRQMAVFLAKALGLHWAN